MSDAATEKASGTTDPLLLEGIPDGVYRFADHIDGLGEHPEPIILTVALTVSGDTVVADWEGTVAQVKGGINEPLSFTKSNVHAQRSVMPQEMPNCHGYTRPITVRAPAGTPVNCTQSAPCGACGITGYCVFGALAPALPDRVTADGAGGLTLPTFAGRHEGRPFVFSECIMGTWGTSQEADGQDGVPHMGSSQSNVPVEMVEADYPLRIEYYGSVTDTGGLGRRRGGLALRRDYRVLTDDCFLGVRSGKRAFAPHGLFGGGEGTPLMNVVEDGNGRTVLPTAPLTLRKGTPFSHVMAGGGGFGNPLERESERESERDDVRDGRLSRGAACRECGAGEVRLFVGYFTDPALPRAAVTAALSAFGSLDTVFVNAVLLHAAPLAEWTFANRHSSLAVNLTAPLLFVQAAALRTSSNVGLLFTASTGALRGDAGMPAYHATKAGFVGLCRSLADELSPQGIRVNCLLPGWVDTLFNGPFWSRQPDKQAAARELVGAISLRRQGTPEELAATVLFLASPAAAYITGTSLVVDGGYTAV